MVQNASYIPYLNKIRLSLNYCLMVKNKTSESLKYKCKVLLTQVFTKLKLIRGLIKVQEVSKRKNEIKDVK